MLSITTTLVEKSLSVGGIVSAQLRSPGITIFGMGTKQSRKRKQRRQMRQILRHGPTAKPTHKGRSGRTGAMHHKKLKGRHPK
jgi:hypothetical protein